MIRILHIIDFLSTGGAARAMAAASMYSKKHGSYHHQVIGIGGVNEAGIALAQGYGMEVLYGGGELQINHWIEQADIVQIEWWNGSFINEFLHRNLPDCRLISWPHIAGDVDPQFLPSELVDFSDLVVASSPVCFSCPTLVGLSGRERSEKVRLVYDCADFARVEGITPVAHQGFNVGYIGTLHPCKMHSQYISMSARIRVPDVYFTLCGGEDVSWLRTEASKAGVSERFHFKGYVSDIRSEISKFDVYGYPLCADTYASAELNLQEVMYSGVPPVVFPYGGVRQLVFHDYTGLVVHSEHEYADAVEYLYRNPAERQRLGHNARMYAQQVFGAENAAVKFHAIYQEAMSREKQNRSWGKRREQSPNMQRLLLADLWPADSPVIGAMRMIDSLNTQELRDLFFSCMYGESEEIKIEALEAVGNLSALMGACIQQYGVRYPEDPFLNIWQGVFNEREGEMNKALFFYSNAIKHGFSRGYLWRYISRVARKAGYVSLAEEAAQRYSETYVS